MKAATILYVLALFGLASDGACEVALAYAASAATSFLVVRQLGGACRAHASRERKFFVE